VIRDPDYSVPHCLREGDDKTFPFPNHFKSLMKRVGRGLGGGQEFGESLTEDEVITFLYEATRNCHDHARENLSHSAISGIRGLIVEKFIFQPREEFRNRAQIPPTISSYLERIWKARAFKQRLILAFTVTDLG